MLPGRRTASFVPRSRDYPSHSVERVVVYFPTELKATCIESAKYMNEDAKACEYNALDFVVKHGPLV